MSKLSNVVDNDVIISVLYDQLVTKVDATDYSVFVLKTQYNTEIKLMKQIR